MSDEKRPISVLPIAIAALVICGGASWFYFGAKKAEPSPQNPTAVSPPKSGPTGSVGTFRPPTHESLAAALADFNSEGDAMLRSQKLEKWIAEVAIDEIAALMELLNQEQDSPLNRQIKLRLIRKFAEQDPSSAAHLAGQQPEGPGRQALLNAVATLWAGQNLAHSITWARSLPDSERGGAFLSIAGEAVSSDPRQALELAREIPASDTRDELVARVASEWATKDPGQIIGWAEQIQDSALKNQVLGHVAVAWGDTEPEKAGALAAEALTPGKTQNDAVVGIVQRWVQKRPADAAAWVARFPEGELREAAASELVNLWSDQNHADAAKWIETLPAGNSRDTAIGVYVSKVSGAHPKTAADWVMNITDEALRARQLERIGESWLATDPIPARAWINASELSPEVKEKLLSDPAR